jgi:DNA-binding IclR family transcriptional regulator
MQKQSTRPKRLALSATRALAVLDHLAAPPVRPQTLSEIARRVGVNVASLHAVLGALEEAAYLTRDPASKTYRLGFVPIAVGQSALQEHPVIDHARRHADALAARLELECIVGVVVGSDLLTTAVAGRPEQLELRPRPGQRIPYRPPFGILGAAKEDEDGLAAWLDRMGPLATTADKNRYREAALALRDRDHEIGLETPSRTQIGVVLGQLAADPHDPGLHLQLHRHVAKLAREPHQLLDPDPATPQHVNNIQAGIYDHRGKLVGGITLLGLQDPLEPHRLHHYVRALVETANQITTDSGGRPPT